MIQGNYFTENSDLQTHFESLIDWETVVNEYEYGFTDASKYAETEDERYAMAPRNVDEAIEYYRSVLESLGDIMGNFVAPRAAEMDRIGLKFQDGSVVFPKAQEECYTQMRDAGLQSFSLSRKYGGLGLPTVVQNMTCEVSARADSAFALAFANVNIADIMERFASDELNEEFIPGLAAGDRSCAMALTEPNHGSNLPGVQTKAVQDENGQWRITGTKRFITHACGYIGAPSVILTLARTGDPQSGARGLSFFVVEGKDVQVAGIEHKMGLTCSPTCEVVYDNSPARLIGETGYGLIKYSMGMMNTARLTVSAQSLGVAQAAFEEARKYASQREQFGKTINQIPAVAKMLSRMERELAAMRCLLYEACATVDRYLWRREHLKEAGKTDKEIRRDKELARWEKLADIFTPLAKGYLSEQCNRITYDAVQIHGGAGFTEEYDVARIYRDSRITSIYEGTTQLQVVAAIGGITAGMLPTGRLRHFVEQEMEQFTPGPELRTLYKSLEEAVDLYKSLPTGEDKELLAEETVWIGMRLVMSLLLERSVARVPGDKRAARERLARDFNVDSLALTEANLLRLRSYARAPATAGA